MKYTVGAVKRRGRKNLVLRVRRDGKIIEERATETTRRRDAEREAEKLQTRLNRLEQDGITWDVFRQRCERERYGKSRPKTIEAFQSMANNVERYADPELLRDLTSSAISQLAAAWREAGLSDQSVESYLGRLRTVLRWAVNDLRILDEVPSFGGLFTRNKKRHMRGRPITTEEFERMLAKVASVVGNRCARRWHFYLRGLWLSGLRLGESLNLQWEASDDRMHVYRINAERPMLRIWEETEKGKRDRLLPITPDFVELLRDVPFDSRHGPVFPLPIGPQAKRTVSEKTVSKKLSAIGRAAQVIVEQHEDEVRFATAHDLRRSFGERWALRVRPIILKELMRHESLETTMKFYVGENAVRTADEVWEAWKLRGSDDVFDDIPSEAVCDEGVDDML